MSHLRSSQWRPARTLVGLVIAALLFSIDPSNQVDAAAGDLDTSFGNGGKVTTDFFGVGDVANDMALQPDGKIVLAGSAFKVTNVVQSDFAVARYNNDGSLDSTFGIGGKVTTDIFGEIDGAEAVAIQPDGRIVAVGSAGSGQGFLHTLVRYNTDGSLDLSFGSGGKVITPINIGGAFEDVAIQPDGKILAAGRTGIFVNQFIIGHLVIARYNSDGSLDPTFGAGGKVIDTFLGGTVAYALALQPDGRIVVAGTFASQDFALVRYNSNGSLDTTFGSGGIRAIDFSGRDDQGYGITIQQDGKIVIVGSTQAGGILQFGVARTDAQGNLDPSFGSGGKVITAFSGDFDRADDVLIQPDGKIVAAGVADGDVVGFALARYNSNGSLDSGFGNGGKLVTSFGDYAEAFAVGMQPDGKIIASGRANLPPAFSPDFALVRYESGPSFDICLQDDSSGNLFQFNSATGDYLFTNCSGFTLGGIGTITRRGSTITLQQNGPDRRVLAKIDGGVNKGTASVQVFATGATFTITDRNTLNNTCSCARRLTRPQVDVQH